MSEQVNEFAMTLPIASVPAMNRNSETTATGPAPEPSYDITSAVSIPTEVNCAQHKHISVYVDSAAIANYNYDDPCICVDLVLNIGITNPTTNATSNFKLVKRVSMDKVKLACQAETQTPVSVIEAKTEEQLQAEKLAEAQEVAAKAAALRAKQLAGLI